MATKAPAASDLRSSLGAVLGDRFTPGDAAYAVDGLRPRFVATPASVDELAAALAAANECGAAVVPWGGGRHMALGNVPERYDVALRTTKLDRVLEYEPADLTVTVEAGTTMGRLQALLVERGQFLPIDAPADATVGGVLAAGVSGPSRHAHGLPRDWLLGCRVAHADGVITKGGGRVVKNVAGYDLPKLAVGSLGTLGLIIEATFKVAPLPAAQETLVADFSSLEAAAEYIFTADERGLALRAVAVRTDEQHAALAGCWLAGPHTAVERSARELIELARGAETERLVGEASERWWTQLNESAAPDAGACLRASLPPSAVVDFMEHAAVSGEEAAVPAASVAYLTTGLVLTRLGGTTEDRVVGAIDEARLLATEAGGTLVVTAAPVAVKQRIDVWGEAQGPAPLARRLREQFDPRRTLNPGRFVRGL